VRRSVTSTRCVNLDCQPRLTDTDKIIAAVTIGHPTLDRLISARVDLPPKGCLGWICDGPLSGGTARILDIRLAAQSGRS
jgi:hypothetical protein